MIKISIEKPRTKKGIEKAIPKDYHLSGVEIERGIGYQSKYFYLTIKITHNDYLKNPELFYHTDEIMNLDYLERLENSRKAARKRNQVDTPYMSIRLEPSQIKIKGDIK